MSKALCFLGAIYNHDALLSRASKLALDEVVFYPKYCGKTFDQLHGDDLMKMEIKLFQFLCSTPVYQNALEIKQAFEGLDSLNFETATI